MSHAQPFLLSGVHGLSGKWLPAALGATLEAPPRSFRAVLDGVNAEDLAQAGWGIVFAPDTPREVEDALSPLMDLRHSQAGRLFRTLRYQPGDDLDRTFLNRHGVGPGPVDPGQLPYYLLLVGSPRSLSFRFQQQLDVQYAIGRLDFDSAADYALYAGNVVAAERIAAANPPAVPPAVTLFFPSHDTDAATRATHADLLTPLEAALSLRPRDCRLDVACGPEATHERLTCLLGRGATPSVLFTAGHGLWFYADEPQQASLQGGLVCSGWSGQGGVHRAHAFVGDDLSSAADVSGLIAFLVGCYTLGTPAQDSYAGLEGKPAPGLASQAFVSNLARRLLARPRGALAIIGHVDKAMLSGFQWPGTTRNVQAFVSALNALIAGRPVGLAMEAFSQRHAELATLLTGILEPGQSQAISSDDLLALWIAHNDARGYSVLGDPAVRIATSQVAARTAHVPTVGA